MSEALDIETDVKLPGFSVRTVLAGLLVLALAGGSFFLTSSGAKAFDGGMNYIATLYSGGGEALTGAWDERAFAAIGLTPADAPAALDQGLLPQGGEPVSEQIVMIDGVPIVEVVMTDATSWCIRPDGVVLPLCIFGEYEVLLDSSVLDSSSEVFGTTAISLEQAELPITILVEPLGTETVELLGTPVLSGTVANWTLANVEQVVDRQVAETGPAITFGGADAFAVFLEGSTTTVEPTEDGLVGETTVALLPANFTIDFENISVPVRIEATYWVRAA